MTVDMTASSGGWVNMYAKVSARGHPHPRTLTPSHPHTLIPGHPHTLAPSHPHLTLTSSPSPSLNLALSSDPKVSLAYKNGETTAVLKTYSGDVITIMQATNTATIVMDGTTYPVSDRVPVGARRLAARISKCA